MALCDWCGRSLTHYNHDGCADGYDANWEETMAELNADGEYDDPWEALLGRMRNGA